MPSASIVSAAIMQISASAAIEPPPTVSASNCMNWRERRGQVVAQAQPLLVVVLEREHALVRAVLVGQELPERVGVLDRRRLDWLEAVALVDRADRLQHLPRRCDLGRRAIREPARQPRLETVLLLVGAQGDATFW